MASDMTDTVQHLGSKTEQLTINQRLASIDALRGLVIVIMLVDHIRDIFFGYLNIGDPVDALTVDTGQFIIRLLSSLCAPVFVLLTGLSAYLYGLNHSKRQLAEFLLKRGLVLIFLEVTIIGFAWTGRLPPDTFYLQVIWVIGLSMIALAALMHLPSKVQWLIILFGIVGHNLLDNIALPSEHSLHAIWAILHQRDWLQVTENISIRTSYPLLPWPSVMLLGFQLGKWFRPEMSGKARQLRLHKLGFGLLITFFIIRAVNYYGDTPWFVSEHLSVALMSFLALTKYPPSLLFLLFTLGVGLIILAYFERWQDKKIIMPFVTFGSAPMFFYIFHLYLIGISYLLCIMLLGPTHGEKFGFDEMWQLWVLFFVLLLPLYFSTLWFGKLKQRRKDIRWLKYF
jgi:uncharacterized membrane protein